MNSSSLRPIKHSHRRWHHKLAVSINLRSSSNIAVDVQNATYQLVMVCLQRTGTFRCFKVIFNGFFLTNSSQSINLRNSFASAFEFRGWAALGHKLTDIDAPSAAIRDILNLLNFEIKLDLKASDRVRQGLPNSFSENLQMKKSFSFENISILLVCKMAVCGQRRCYDQDD